MNTPPSFPLTIFYPYTTFEYISCTLVHFALKNERDLYPYQLPEILFRIVSQFPNIFQLRRDQHLYQISTDGTLLEIPNGKAVPSRCGFCV